ncbi:ABC transporter permease [Saliterribacillus persicus]|uniref:Acetoin utilization transport system permease protein n=1 Tax=Saliterribacillus persicus TaxID=930114 RepID=A0A368XYI3_9BACI|nr:ABC transporter permease [Saliterribacillus persicus]RCW73053.1 acetoin utilization transport system permease protein [Saliterribacillus persicus]
MTFKDQWRFVMQNIKKSKSRVFMTILATAMGVTFLIVLASVGFGLHDSIVKETLEDRAITKIQVAGLEDESGNGQGLTDKEIKEIEAMQGIKTVTRRIHLSQSPTFSLEDYTGYAQNTVVAHFPSELEAGLELAKGEFPEDENEIIVGHDFISGLTPENIDTEELYDEEGRLKEEYMYEESLLGKTITLTVLNSLEEEHQVQLEIVGMTQKPARDWMQDSTVFITEKVLREIEAFTGTPKGEVLTEEESSTQVQQEEVYDDVYAYADNLEAVEPVTEALKGKNYYIYSVADELKNINIMFTIAKAGLIFIGTIAIIIASIGIYNTMTMAVTERTPDIGIMKAMGAHPKVIKQIFLLESSYIGIIGAVIGTAVAYLISVLVNIGLPFIIETAFDEQLPEGLTFSSIPWSLILISVVICLSVTILSGLKPAKRATKIDILRALRRDI